MIRVGTVLLLLAWQRVVAEAASAGEARTWVYDDARNPWSGRAVASADDGRIDAVRAFVDRTTQIFDAPDDISLETLLQMETALHEHFRALMEAAPADADETIELHASLQDLMELIASERRYIKAHPSAPLSDAFVDIHDDLLAHGYDATTFESWVAVATTEVEPAVAYAQIAQYLLLEPNAKAHPLTSLKRVHGFLAQAPTLASTQVLHALLALAFNDTDPSAVDAAEAAIRLHAPEDYVARMVLAERLWTQQWAAKRDDEALCDHVVALYYTSAEESVRDLADGVEPEPMEGSLRLSQLWMQGSQTNAYFGEVPENGLEALDYYQSLAHGGDAYLSAEAAHRLGEMHFFGDANVPADAAAARPFFERAAAGGIPHALANLGLMHAHGLGVKQNSSAAVDLFTQAAELGFAQHGLGVVYWNGDALVPRNVTRAVTHFEAAIDLEYFEAHQYLGAAYLDGVGVPRNVTRAFEHFMAASVKAPSRQSLFNVGVLYYQGSGVQQSCESALRHFRAVALRRDLPGFSVRHAIDSFVAGDATRALVEHLLLAQLSHVDAMVNAAFQLEKRLGDPWVPRPLETALRWYEHAAEQHNDSEALRQLGQCHEAGWADLCAPNASQALQYYHAASGDAEALYHAGWLHLAAADWRAARDAFAKCRAFAFPHHAPCVAPGTALDAWSLLHDLAAWWSTLW
ncbi:hypothetical protein SPRG_16038 [Saprolegnia parasitica CBS 223.65]|uniref:Uncharacterized protein n=1 Tax=Saprolegnia parasitica (strain CBS 223.65) TaxID=695850 RepID=A0A067BJF7_SAPPC|nr:hypothetical protein SPRG_16038 [Saprolegnia parasitica CBS 223.65]KDO18569.1 hypothetical protein SPRG_16038 [Saprolegnia parasitica CBS 223.65]|eukprot:XP_012210720.1 hypothetical protein SPRG_16038 [Saprolegnia parasitica CBS 223.65]